MAEIHESIKTLQSNLKSLKRKYYTMLEQTVHDDFKHKVDELNNEIKKLIDLRACQTPKRGVEFRCAKCEETNPIYFYRKITECIQCMSKSNYEKIKLKIESGKQRNIQARFARGECTDCAMKVTNENIPLFDWDHRDPSEKVCTVARLNYKTDDVFQSEIEKCDLVCKLCHTKRTKMQYENKVITSRKSDKK